MKLEVHKLSYVYDSGSGRPALDEVSLQVGHGEFLAIVGSSGSGKSTLLNVVGGFLSPTQGSVAVAGKPICGPGADRVMIFQKSGLFPFYTVSQNVEYGLKLRGVGRVERESRTREILATIGLSKYYSAFPRELSEGMSKLVEIARALVIDSQVLLFDEALGNLDALTRYRMQHLIEELWLKHRTTILWVTHDLEEAALLADRVIVLSCAPGHIVGTKEVHFPRPRTEAVRTSSELQSLRTDLFTMLGGGGRKSLTQG